jgi:hypothetical protein
MKTSLRTTLLADAFCLILLLGASIARSENKANKSGLLARAGAVEVLEFEKTVAIKQVRIVEVTPAGTNVVSDTINGDGDFCDQMRVGIVQLRHGGDAAGKFLVTFQFSNLSTQLETEYSFFRGANANPVETYAPRVLKLSDSVWTQVYRFKEPESEFRVELLGDKKFEQPGGTKYFLP